jgi:hypothetical protein
MSEKPKKEKAYWKTLMMVHLQKGRVGVSLVWSRRDTSRKTELTFGSRPPRTRSIEAHRRPHR